MSLVISCHSYGANAPLLATLTHNGRRVDPGLVLWAIAGNESRHGALREFVRTEPGYLPDGHYYRRSASLRQHYARWGCLASASFGTWQIMYETAFEMGFRGHPIELQQDACSVNHAIALIEKRFMAGGATTLAEVLDAYNSGTHKDRVVPEKYIKDGIAHYDKGWPNG
jgi:hypothetical protein